MSVHPIRGWYVPDGPAWAYDPMALVPQEGSRAFDEVARLARQSATPEEFRLKFPSTKGWPLLAKAFHRLLVSAGGWPIEKPIRNFKSADLDEAIETLHLVLGQTQPLSLNPEQRTAIQAIVAGYKTARENSKPLRDHGKYVPETNEGWLRLEHGEFFQRTLVIAGAAGVGKTTITVEAILTLMEEQPDLRVVRPTAYSHSAVSVLRSSMAARLEEQDEIRHLDLEWTEWPVQDEAPIRGWALKVGGIPRRIEEPRTLLRAARSTYTPPMDEDPDSYLAYTPKIPCQLWLVDEASMVPAHEARYILANAAAPVLWVGDPGQLPPVESYPGSDYFTTLVNVGYAKKLAGFGDLMHAPNHRTKLESVAILDLAAEVRRRIVLPPLKVSEIRPPAQSNELDDQFRGWVERLANPGRGLENLGLEGAVARHLDAGKLPANGQRPTSVFVVGRHRTRSRINALCRKNRGWANTRAMPGEWLIVESGRSSPGGPRLNNNEWVRVEEVLGEEDFQPQFENFPEGPTIPVIKLKVQTVDGRKLTIMSPIWSLGPVAPGGPDWEGTSIKWTTFWSKAWMPAKIQLSITMKEWMIKVYGSPNRVSTRVALAMWTGTARIHKARGQGSWDKPLAVLGVDPNFVLTPRLKLQLVLGEYEPFIPRLVLNYKAHPGDIINPYDDADRQVVKEMLALERSGLVWLHYADAVTGHSAQGSQFEDVYLNFDPPALYGEGRLTRSKDQQIQEALRWTYVGTTRARRRLAVLAQHPLLNS